MELNRQLRNYLRNYQQDWDYRHQGVVASFEIDDLALSVGKFYEQIRKVIDWKEENALRRGAIARAVKRHLVTQIYNFDRMNDGEKIRDVAEVMVFELMRSGYFDNDFINASKVNEVGRIAHKYIVILQDLNSHHGSLSRRDLKQRIRLQTWTIEIAACEIEECLAPPFKTQALIDLMGEVLDERIKVVPTNAMSKKTKDKFLLIALWQSLFSSDDYFIAYVLLKFYDEDFLQQHRFFDGAKVQAIFALKEKIELDLRNKAGRKFLRIANKYDAAYRMIGAITKRARLESVSAGEAFFGDEQKVKGFFEEMYDKRHRSLRIRLLKMAFWTTLSILLANAASVFILEWPVAGLLGYDFGWGAITADLLIPSVVMFLLVILIRPPRSENKEVMWKEIEKTIYKTSENDVYEIRLTTRGNRALQIFFYFSTLVTGLVGLVVLYWIFRLAGLPPTSIYLNIVYITMVLFASLSIRQRAQELTIFERTGIFDFILDIFAIPLAHVGQWFSKKWKEYNIFSILFSVLIDAPLSLFIGFIEDWRNFLKESKSEIR